MNEKDQKTWREILHGNAILNSEDAVKLYEENKRLEKESEQIRDAIHQRDENLRRLEKVTERYVHRMSEQIESPQVGKLQQDIKLLQEALREALNVNQGISNFYLATKATETRYHTALQAIPQLGHNDDCMFCALKDKKAFDALQKEDENSAI